MLLVFSTSLHTLFATSISQVILQLYNYIYLRSKRIFAIKNVLSYWEIGKSLADETTLDPLDKIYHKQCIYSEKYWLLTIASGLLSI